MELATELERALAGFRAEHTEVRENGEWLAGLDGLQYEVRGRDGAALLHLWGAQQNLVRRVVRIAEKTPERLVVEVKRLGHSQSAQLEFCTSPARRDERRVGREQFCNRLRQLLVGQFPDEVVDSMATAADLGHSISGSYARGLMRLGSKAHAVLGVAPDEDSATVDGILTFGLIWLDRVRDRARHYTVEGLRLFLPRGTSAITAHRLTALVSPGEVELYEYDPMHWRVRRLALSDAGNLATRLVPRAEVDRALALALPEAERIRLLAPDAIHVGVASATNEVTLRFRGIEFARRRDGAIWFGLGNRQQLLTPEKWPAMETLVRELNTYRNPLASDTKHRLYRAQPERWLETMIAADPGRVDARLDPRQVYAQVPAFSVSHRGIIDLLAVTRDGRLAVLELKASEDIQLVMQAVDYWLRVRWHQDHDDFRRYGYFAYAALRPEPPLLFLIAPGLRFHPSSDILLRYLSPKIEIARVGLGENWRRGLRVVLRQ